MRRNNNNPSTSRPSLISQPLLTELRDLDLELELLKRKREMIEEQQQLLTNPTGQRFGQKQYGYNQSGISFNEYGQSQSFDKNRNFSHLYGDTNISSGGNNYNRPLGNKRKAEEFDWQTTPPQKRFASSQRGNPKKSGNLNQGSRLMDLRPVTGQGSQQFMGQQFRKTDAQSQGDFSQMPRANFEPMSQHKVQQSQAYQARPSPFSKQKWNKSNNEKSSFVQNSGIPATPTFRNNPKFKKVKKNKPPATIVPNRLNSYPLNERKALIDKASPFESKEDGDMILRVNEQPTNTMTGRLELALGNILKSMMDKYGKEPPYEKMLAEGFAKRLLKQSIRERIRNVMINKHVGSMVTICKYYYDVYKEDMDIELLKHVHKQYEILNNRSNLKLLKADNADEYFKVNFEKLLTTKLDEMFHTLKYLFKNKHDLKALLVHMPDPNTTENIAGDTKEQESSACNTVNITDDEKDPAASDTVNVTEDTKEKESSASDTVNVTEATEEKESCASVTANITEEMEEKEPLASDIANITEDTKEKESPTSNEIIITDDTKEKDQPASDTLNIIEESKEQESSANDTINIIEESKEKESSGSNTVQIEEQSQTLETKPTGLEQNKEPNINFRKPVRPHTKAKYYEKVMEALIENKLPEILPRYKETLLKIFNSDREYRLLKTAIKVETVKLIRTDPKYTPKESAVGNQDGNTLPFIAKVIGEPFLPRKTVMREFLDRFRPKSIKKHKRNSNLLFIGFDDINDFENLLKADNIVLGGVQLSITICEKTNENYVENVPIHSGDGVLIIEDRQGSFESNNSQNFNANADKLICTELDSQIDDLLSSIRKAEEESGVVDIKNDGAVIKLDTISEKPEDEAVEVNTQNEGDLKNETDEPIKEGAIGENAENEAIEENAENEATENGENGTEDATQREGTRSETIEDQKVVNTAVETVKIETETEPGRAAPTRSSARLANANSTPSTIKTRRASKLAQAAE